MRRLSPDGVKAWHQVLAARLRGYVAKDEGSPYRGGPTKAWLKVKQQGWAVEKDRWRRRLFAWSASPELYTEPGDSP